MQFSIVILLASVILEGRVFSPALPAQETICCLLMLMLECSCVAIHCFHFGQCRRHPLSVLCLRLTSFRCTQRYVFTASDSLFGSAVSPTLSLMMASVCVFMRTLCFMCFLVLHGAQGQVNSVEGRCTNSYFVLSRISSTAEVEEVEARSLFLGTRICSPSIFPINTSIPPHSFPRLILGPSLGGV